MDEKTFPVIGYGRVPYHLAEQAYRTYAARWGSSQTLERLGERGGFHPVEFTDFLFNRRTPNGDGDREKQAEALIEIAAVVERCCPQRVERLEQERDTALSRLATAEAENGRLKVALKQITMGAPTPEDIRDGEWGTDPSDPDDQYNLGAATAACAAANIARDALAPHD